MGTLRVGEHEAIEVDAGTTLLDACEDAGIPIDSDCGGVAACNACRVRVVSGMTSLSPRLDEEDPFLDTDDQRLGCQCTVTGSEVVVELDPGL